MKKATNEKVTRIILHFLICAIILVLPIYAARRFRMGANFLLTYYTFMAINAFIFYINYLLLVPVLFLKKKRYSYYFTILAILLSLYFVSDFANQQVNSFISENNPEQLNGPPGQAQTLRPSHPPRLRTGFLIVVPYAHLIGYTSSSVLMVFLSLGIRVLERQSKIEKMQEEMEKTRLNAELAFLKNQISPHFFFNTLNNIYSLIGKNAEDSRKAVVKLSKLMRYILDESEHDYKHLSQEIEFMNNYIDIMKLRIGEKTKLMVDFPVEYKDISIPPLLFISLIENAFKYGVSVQEESNIKISFEYSEKNICFTCVNSLPENSSMADQGSHGIGLDNLKKRLKLLFPDRHELKFSKTDNTFEVCLTIQLKE
jgi:two-component system, LytTR family, sensor kinase